MQRHVKVYMDHFGYGIDDFIPCEACGAKSVDIHHIFGRGKGKDVIDNLMALCRDHHVQAHSSRSKDEMQLIHTEYLNKNTNGRSEIL